MPRYASAKYRFSPSTAPDVDKYRIYYKAAVDGQDFDYSEDYVDIGMFDGLLNDEGLVEVDLPIILPTMEGLYDIAVTALDKAGNESDFGGVVMNAPLDFVAPGAPGLGSIGE